jgi:hypothetical protein
VRGATARPSPAAFLTIPLLALALAGCSGGDDEPQPTLAITREDGSAVEIPGDLRAWCGVPRSQGDAGRSLHVLAGDEASSYWLFRAELEELERSTRLAVPQVPVDTPSWSFFVNDVERDNEVATHTEESSGSIEVEEWGCDEGDAVTLSVDARIASEIGGESIQVRGTVTAEIGSAPDGYEG